MRRLAFILGVACLFAIASADQRNCWAVTWSWFDNSAGGSETKPTAEDFADSEKAPPVGMPDGVPAVQKHGKCLCGEHVHRIEVIENMKYWWLKEYDLCSEDDTIYYVNASNFADGMTEQDAYDPGGIWRFKAKWLPAFHLNVPVHICGPYTQELWLEYKYVSEAGSLTIEKGSSMEGGLSAGVEDESGAEAGPEGPKTKTAEALKVGASFSASAFGKKGMTVSFSWVLMKKGPEHWGPGGSERIVWCSCGQFPFVAQPNTSQPDRIFVQPRPPLPPRMDTLKVPRDNPRIFVNSDDVRSAKVLYGDGTEQELAVGANNARIGVYDPQRASDSDKDVLVILTAAGTGGGLLASVFGLAPSDDSTRPETATAPPSLKRPDLGLVPVDGSSMAVSADGSNLLGADPALASSFLESDSKVVYPNLEVRTNSQVLTVYDRALESADIGKNFNYTVRTSEGVATARVATTGLTGATARPSKIVKGQVATVYVDRAGFAKLPPDMRITFKLEPSPNARLVSPAVVETTRAALEASNYSVGQVTGLVEGELVVKVEAQFPDLKGPDLKDYSAPLPAETQPTPAE